MTGKVLSQQLMEQDVSLPLPETFRGALTQGRSTWMGRHICAGGKNLNLWLWFSEIPLLSLTFV